MTKITLYISQFQLKQMLKDSKITIDRFISIYSFNPKEGIDITIERSD